MPGLPARSFGRIGGRKGFRGNDKQNGQGFGFQVSGFGCQEVESLNPERLYETTFDECGSRNVECGRMESLRSVFLINKNR